MNTFNILGDIVMDDSERYFDSDVVPSMVIGWLAKQEGDVQININSAGGSIAGGLAIANAFKGYSRGKVTANVMGVAASMASVIACSADELRMAQGSFLMIHNPWVQVVGEAEDLRKSADTLDQMKASIISFYQSKFSTSGEELARLMDEETWISAEDVGSYGLDAKPYVEEFRAAAKCDTRMMFAKAPEAAAAYYAHREMPAPEASAEEAPAEAASAEEVAPEAPAEEAAPEAPAKEPVAETPEEPHDDWQARYKGASKKLNEIRARHEAELADIAARHRAALDSLDGQLRDARGDLEKAKADLSSACARAEAAEKDLAAKSEQLDRLQKAHALLTGGVLTPGDGLTDAERYARDLKAAKSPEQREAIRKARKSGIK